MGSIKITFYANNSYNQSNLEEIYVIKNNSIPNITVFTPNSYDRFGIETINYDLLVDDPNLNSTWYSLNGGLNVF
ncbi:unnamed protein product, partial [marine sediment metagenome]